VICPEGGPLSNGMGSHYKRSRKYGVLVMSTGTSRNEPNDDSAKEEDTNPDPSELLRRAEDRAERKTRGLFRDLRRQVARGAAFEAGKELYEFIRELTEHD